MAGSAAETLIGAAVLVAAGGFLVYAANTADVSTSRGGYEIMADFRKAEGLKPGADVMISGIKIGTLHSMELNPTTYSAVATLAIRPGVEIPEDSLAKITTASLLGDSFVAIDPGSSDYMLVDGDALEYTQGSVNLMDLVGKLVQGGGE